MDLPRDWPRLVDLVERVVSEDDLLTSVVIGTRTAIREVAALSASDMSGHTRALLAAATRAITARRGPTETELSFVAELAVVRAEQGVPVEAVLAAIHVAERAIWARIRSAAEVEGVRAEPLLDARELYDDWADAVRSRLISAYQEARADQVRGTDRTTALIRRLLGGGTAAALAAAEVGMTGPLWVSVRRSRPSQRHQGARGPRAANATGTVPVSGPPSALFAEIDGLDVSIEGSGAEQRDRTPHAIGLAGPAPAENLAVQYDLAIAALIAAEATGRVGMTHIADVATLAAVVARPDLALVLLERHRHALEALGQSTEPVMSAVRAWFEADRDAGRAAERLFVHPNTVRNRLQRFAEGTGIDTTTPSGAVDAWSLARAWLDRP